MAIYSWFPLLKMVIFHSYVSLPEGSQTFIWWFFGEGTSWYLFISNISNLNGHATRPKIAGTVTAGLVEFWAPLSSNWNTSASTNWWQAGRNPHFLGENMWKYTKVLLDLSALPSSAICPHVRWNICWRTFRCLRFYHLQLLILLHFKKWWTPNSLRQKKTRKFQFSLISPVLRSQKKSFNLSISINRMAKKHLKNQQKQEKPTQFHLARNLRAKLPVCFG